LYTAQKSNSHYTPQPYTNQSVFKSLLNCTSEISLSHNATGSEFQRHGLATEKLLSPRRIRVLFVTHVKTSEWSAADVSLELTIFSQVLWKLTSNASGMTMMVKFRWW